MGLDVSEIHDVLNLRLGSGLDVVGHIDLVLIAIDRRCCGFELGAQKTAIQVVGEDVVAVFQFVFRRIRFSRSQPKAVRREFTGIQIAIPNNLKTVDDGLHAFGNLESDVDHRL